MIELRFHRELYQGKAIDEAVKTYASYATFEQAEEAEHWIVRVTGSERVAREFANYALGLTIKSVPQ